MHLSALVVAVAVAASAPAAKPKVTVTIEHVPPTAWVPEAATPLEAKLVCVEGAKIFDPALFVRPAGGQAKFQRISLTPKEAGFYQAKVPPEIAKADFEYYLESFDEDGNGPFRKGDPEAPLKITVLPPVPVPVPVAAVQRPAPEPSRPLRDAGLGLVISGAAVLAGGAVAGVFALDGRNAEQQAVARNDRPAYDAAKERYHASLYAMDALLAVGGAAAATGAVLLVLSHLNESSAPVKVSFSSDGRGAAAVVCGTF